MKKRWWLASALAVMMTCSIGLAACGGGEMSSPNGSNGSSVEDSSVETPKKPTAAEVVAARKKAKEVTLQGYDFSLDLSADLQILGLGGGVNGRYDGQYRENTETGEMQFKRVTSGALLNDSTAYVMQDGVQKIKITMDDGKVKKASVVTDDDGATFIHKPFVALIDSLTATEISDVVELEGGEYEYQSQLAFSANNPVLDKVLGVVGKLGTTISVKGAEIDNPVNGLKLQYNIDDDGALSDFALAIKVVVPIKMATATICLSYEQKAASSAVEVPSSAGILYKQADMQTDVAVINNALTELKNDDDYSLDLVAENEFDPGWNKLATVDKYTARLYKNTTEEGVWFNHSYEYKAHHEEDGAETYKYTIGNIQDGSVHIVSRKGGNVVTAAEGITLDTQFTYLTEAVMQSASNLECMRKETKNGSTFYHLYLNAAAAASTQDIILDLINSNDAQGVVDVNNYFDAENYTVKEAEIVVEMKNGKIVDISCLTELQYTPTDGEYVEYVVTLTNKIQLKVNENLEKASKYEAPSKAAGAILGLEAFTKYIL